MSQTTRFSLSQADIPKQWYNLLADFPEPLPPPLHPGTRQPVAPEMMTQIFPENLVQAGNVPGPMGRNPGTRARGLCPVAANAAFAGGAAWNAR